jgi:hypothetical protein
MPKGFFVTAYTRLYFLCLLDDCSYRIQGVGKSFTQTPAFLSIFFAQFFQYFATGFMAFLGCLDHLIDNSFYFLLRFASPAV